MGYDRRRAAVLTLALSALLLAATLMPAAGVGSFSPFGDSGERPAPSDPASDPATPTADPVTADPRVTATSTPTPEPTTTETTSEQPREPRGNDEDESPLFWWILTGLIVGGFASAGAYVSVVGAVALTLGQEAAAKLPLGGRIQALPQTTMLTLIGLSGSLSKFARQLGAVVGGIATGLQGLGGVATAAGGGLAGLAGLVGSVGRGASLGFGSVFGSLGGALSALATGGTTRSTATTSETTTDARTEAPVEPEMPTDEPERGPLSVSEAWDLLTDNLRIRNLQAKTPAEIRSSAIERGWPASPVEQLTAVFQEVRYGGKAETDQRQTAAREAIERLEHHWSENE